MRSKGINVPDHVENEQTYIKGAIANIKRNAMKSRYKIHRERMANDPDYAATVKGIWKKADKGGKFWVSLKNAIDDWGALSENQLAAAKKALEKDAQRLKDVRRLDAGSRYVGTPGERRSFSLELKSCFEAETRFGISYVHYFKDDDGNVFVWKASNKLDVERGHKVELVASIKDHKERDGVQQTIITRGKVQ